MNALALLTEARDAGVKVTVEGTKIVLEGDGLTDKLVAGFKANKPKILKALTAVSTWSSDDVGPRLSIAGSKPDVVRQSVGSLCDDCGHTTAIALVSNDGSRYCRACVFALETRGSQKGTR
jgi:hypothetical protein